MTEHPVSPADLSAYRDGALDASRRRMVEEHLGSCAACQARLNEYGWLGSALQGFPAAAVPSSVDHRVAALLRPAPRTAPRWTLPTMMFPRSAMVALAAAAILVVAFLAGLPMGPGSTGPMVASAFLYADQGKSAIEVQFTEPVNQDSVAQSIQIDPPVDLKVSWRDDTTMVIKPAEPLHPANRYTLKLKPAGPASPATPVAIQFAGEVPASPVPLATKAPDTPTPVAATATASPTARATAVPTAPAPAAATPAPDATANASPTPPQAPTSTRTPEASATPVGTASSPTPTATPGTVTPTPTAAGTATPTSPSQGDSATPTWTATPTVTGTPATPPVATAGTATATPTATPTLAATSTPATTSTPGATSTPATTSTPTTTSTAEATSTPEPTPTPRGIGRRETTATPEPPSEPADTPTPEPAATPEDTTEVSPTPTAEETATPDTETVPETETTATPTATPFEGLTRPGRGVSTILQNNPQVAPRLGRASSEETYIQMVRQDFQRGTMFLRLDTGEILVLLRDGRWETHLDSWEEGEVLPDAPAAPAGMAAPIHGFGKLWREDSGLQADLGWAVSVEEQLLAATQQFAAGQTLWTADGIVYALYQDGSWRSFIDWTAAPTTTPTAMPEDTQSP